MGVIYGNEFINESTKKSSLFNELNFIVYEEYCNYKQLLESCVDDNNKAILEAKCEVLYEVSIKDIKNTIINFLKKIRDIIKDCIQKIKDFFNKKKQKDLEEKIKELEKTLKEKDIEISKIKSDRDKAHKSSIDMSKFAKDQMASNEKQYNDHMKEINKIKSDSDAKLSEERKKVQDAKEEAERISIKLARIVDNIVDNDLLYFDAYDFLKKDFDPHRIVNNSSFTDIMYSNGDEDDKYIEANFNKLMNFANVIPENLAKKYLMHGENNVDLGYGAYNHVDVHNMIKEEIRIKKEKNYTRFSALDELLEQCKWLINGYQVSGINNAMNGYNSLIGKVENFIMKLGGEDNISPEKLNNFRKFIKELDNSVRYMAVLVNYAGRAVGAASQAIIVLNGVVIKKEIK